MESAAPIPAAPDAATTEIHPVLIARGDEHCRACGGPLSADQRYCVQCGERRGPAAAPLKAGGTTRAASVSAAAVRRFHVSDSTGLIAGVGTLLLAMGVGVLIGRTGNTTPSAKSAPYQVVTVGAAGGAAATSTAPAATAAAPTATKAGAAAKAAASAAAAKPTPKTPPPPPARPNTGPNRPGYTNGKFTGNFFGP